jgi:hypothetical protein
MKRWLDSTVVLGIVTLMPPVICAQSVVLSDGGVEFPDGSLQSAAVETAPASLARSGQSSCFDATGALTQCGVGVGAGQDGHLQLGIGWPLPRFTKNGDGTVTDNLTGYIWLENANCAGTTMNFDAALAFANTLFDGSTSHGGGDCGLSDGSVAGDWPVPNLFVAISLLHKGYTNPGLPDTTGTGQWSEGDPFTGVQTNYWISTFNPQNKQFAFYLALHPPFPNSNWKTALYSVWPVRGPIDAGAPASVALSLADGGIEFPDGTVQSTAAQALRIAVPRTGQTSCYTIGGGSLACAGSGQDGDHLSGVAWPNPRFTDRGDGTVKDNLTGLVWLEDANCNGTRTWEQALSYANSLFDGSLTSGGVGGDCGLEDGSIPGEWRLPTLAEFLSLGYLETENPAIPNTAGDGQWVNDDPFLDIVLGNLSFYWTSTSTESSAGSAYVGFARSQNPVNVPKGDSYLVWPVRGDR